MSDSTTSIPGGGGTENAARSLAPLALIAAGGEGKRLGSDGPKALVRCAGRSLLAWSLEAFAGSASFVAGGRVIVAAHKSDLPAFEQEIAPFRSGGLDVQLCVGGPSRSHSVRNALLSEADQLSDFGTVLVHDAARPLAGAGLVEACLAARVDGIDGVVPAAPVTDTIKQTKPDQTVTATLDRSTLWAVQTPQAFSVPALAAALSIWVKPDDDALASATDDASLVEADGGVVKILPWTEPNPKVTTAADLEIVAGLLASR